MLTDDRNDPSKKLMQYRSDRSTEWYLTFMCAFNFRSVLSFFFFFSCFCKSYIHTLSSSLWHKCLYWNEKRERERKENLLVERNNLICTYIKVVKRNWLYCSSRLKSRRKKKETSSGHKINSLILHHKDDLELSTYLKVIIISYDSKSSNRCL
jgi:hypothetical protein